MQLFSLMEANPPLLDLLVDICGTAPGLARYLGANAGVLDAVIAADFYRPLGSASELRASLGRRLAGLDDYERTLDTARAWMKERTFRIGVHLLRGLAEPEAAAAAYSAVADTILQAVWPVVTADFATRHGPPPGAGAALVAMGKLGSREMTATSDLDLIVIYDAAGTEASEGRRPLPVTTYYARLTQALIAALTAPMAEGILYKVDMRLRPSGQSGPARDLPPRLPPLPGRGGLDLGAPRPHPRPRRRRPRRRSPRRSPPPSTQVLARPRDPAKVLADAADMRRRLAEAHEGAAANPWEVKLGPGRMMDIELLAQTGALLGNLAGVRRPHRMLDRLGAAGWLPRPDAALLARALDRLHTLQQIGRLASDDTIDPAEGGDGLVRLVLHATEAPDLDTLRRTLAEDASRAAAIIGDRLADSPAREETVGTRPVTRPLRILGILGSARRLSTNTALLRAMAAMAPSDIAIDVFDRVGDSPVFSPSLETPRPPDRRKALHREGCASDGLVIASPEYVAQPCPAA